MDSTADFFWHLRSGGPAPEGIPDQLVPATMADAYRSQAVLVDRMLCTTTGCKPVGYKIACTSKVARDLFNANGPVYGRLLSCRSWPDGTTLEASEFPMVSVEPEFAFRMAETVPGNSGEWTGDSITRFVGHMIPSLEIVGRRLAAWSAYCAESLAADNAVHMGWVHGEETEHWHAADLNCHPVTLSVNGRTQLSGSGANVMGSPLNALAWLANELPRHGHQLQEGDMVTTGVCTDVHAAGPGESLLADFGDLGAVSLAFA